MKKTPKKKAVVLKDLKDIPPVTPPKSRPSKERKPTIETHSIRHTFTVAESQALGGQLANCMSEHGLVDADRKQIADSFKAKLSAIKSRAEEAAAKIRAGFEYRPMQVYVRFYPKENKKRFFIADGKKAPIVGEEDMTSMDHQFCLDLPIATKPTSGVDNKSGVVVTAGEAGSVGNDQPESSHTSDE